MNLKYLLLLSCFISQQLFSQVDNITFRRISPPGGFSFQAVNIITQDMMGYIWMGSSDGVIRYDSKEVVRFRHQSSNEKSIPSNRISGIVVDNFNNIWVSTDAGLCLFNSQNQSFDKIDYQYEDGTEANKRITSITLDGNGTLWISDNQHVGYLDRKNNLLVRLHFDHQSILSLLYTDETNHLWLGSEDGTVYLIHSDAKHIEKKIEGTGSDVRSIFATNNQIWVGYDAHGARLYNMDGSLNTHYLYPENPDFNFASASIRKIYKDTRGRLWFASYYGLFMVTGTRLIRFGPEEFSGLPHKSIYDLHEDSQGGLWISSWAGGVAYLHHSDNKFRTFRHSANPNSLSGNMVSAFAQTDDGELLVGTEPEGLNSFDKKTNSFTKIKVRENDAMLNVKSLCVDNYGGICIGTAFDGLYYKEKGQNKFLHIPLGDERGPNTSRVQVYSLCGSDSGIWIGSSKGRLLFYSFKKKEVISQSVEYPLNQLNNVTIRYLSLDSNDNLWVATQSGLFQVNLPTGKMKRFGTDPFADFKIEPSAFYFVRELSDGRIWIGTRANGIYIFDPQTEQVTMFDANGLLKGQDVYGIIESVGNTLWITSDNGLILWEEDKNRFRRFEITDGIQGNLFNPGAIFKDTDNALYFGGTNGFSQLSTNQVKMNKLEPNVLITKVEVNHKNIVPTQPGINRFDKLVLNPEERTLKFHFSADNYLLSEKNRFTYRLRNYFDDWVSENKDGTATFINVPAGDYIFEVLACNNDGVWNDKPARLPIKIKQFWYKSSLAFLLYTIALISVLFVIIRFLLERSKLKKTILIEKIKHEQEDQINDMKIRFFTNISHEFRTPLTLINWPVKNLLESDELTSEQREQLNTVKRNTNRLLQLINQIMDLRKVEKGKTKLNISKVELVEFTKERFLNFSEEAKQKNIQFQFNHQKDSYQIEADEEKLDKIIYNILSNAFKYTPVNGTITVIIQDSHHQKNNYFSNQLSFGKIVNEDYIEIQVIDNGEGIDSEYLPNIFDRFEQGKKSKTSEYSTGIGLDLCKEYTLMHRGVIIVQSTPEEGTSFSVRLPNKQKAQKILYENQPKVKNINSWQSIEKSTTKIKGLDEKIKILIVEDNKELRKYLIKSLQKYYYIIAAENGQQGLETLKTQNIQLIISDVMMPVMDGFEFCKNVKSQIETSHIPIILLTALSSAENTATGLEMGADAYISKPFDENVLISQVDNLLKQRKRLQENYTQKFISKEHMEIGSLDNYFLNKVNSVIENNIGDEEFSVEKLAAELGFSRSQLHRKLKHISNHTSSEYIMMVRIRKATSLLTSGQFSIDEVAFKTGFNSHSYFTKCFKKFMHKSPKEYSKNL